MGEIYGIGATHSPYLLHAPENLPMLRKIVLGAAAKRAGKPFVEAPEAVAQIGDDPIAAAREDHQGHWEAFRRLRQYIDEVQPDAILTIGDDQGQCFKANNLPPFVVYVGDRVQASPFYNQRAPGDEEYVRKTWGVSTDHTYDWPCHGELAVSLRDELIQAGFDIASSNDLSSPHWKHGLSHAHANTQLLLRNDDGKYPIVPLLVNSYGADLNVFGEMAALQTTEPQPTSGFPPAPTMQRFYDLGCAIRKILREHPARVLICPSSTWSHTWLATRFDGMRMDLEGNREKLGWLERGEGERLVGYDSPDIEANGDHELRNWTVAAGIMGTRPLEVVWKKEAWISTGFRVFGIWR